MLLGLNYPREVLLSLNYPIEFTVNLPKKDAIEFNYPIEFNLPKIGAIEINYSIEFNLPNAIPDDLSARDLLICFITYFGLLYLTGRVVDNVFSIYYRFHSCAFSWLSIGRCHSRQLLTNVINGAASYVFLSRHCCCFSGTTSGNENPHILRLECCDFQGRQSPRWLWTNEGKPIARDVSATIHTKVFPRGPTC